MSLSGNKELPPSLNALIMISSDWKSVGLTTTFTPLDKVIKVLPKGPFSFLTILPAFGFSAIRGSLDVLSS